LVWNILLQSISSGNLASDLFSALSQADNLNDNIRKKTVPLNEGDWND
jgi:hypothetical protein